MRVLIPGHVFDVDELDGCSPHHRIQFVNRVGEKYPGNYSPFPGTNCQELLRVLISRIFYLDNQLPYWTNKVCIFALRVVLNLFEYRAAKRHHRKFRFILAIEKLKVCEFDLHLRY
jgi:hypothetical protein